MFKVLGYFIPENTSRHQTVYNAITTQIHPYLHKLCQSKRWHNLKPTLIDQAYITLFIKLSEKYNQFLVDYVISKEMPLQSKY